MNEEGAVRVEKKREAYTEKIKSFWCYLNPAMIYCRQYSHKSAWKTFATFYPVISGIVIQRR